MLHRGQIVEKIVRKSGYPLTKLAIHLGISRNTLYNSFLRPDLSWHFISKVGKYIHYDFTLEFPELKKEHGLIDRNTVLQIERRQEQLAKRFRQLRHC